MPLMSLAGPLSPEFSDLLDVASAIHIADRIALREIPDDPRLPDDRWHRKLKLIVPVRHASRWRQRAVLARLNDMLAFLTDDEWHFEFIRRIAAPRASELQISYLPPMSESVQVALHSGGLDSLYALATLRERFTTSLLVPLTVVSSDRIRQASGDVIKCLRQESSARPSKIRPVQPKIEVPRRRHPHVDQEPSQRARAVLFLASGIVAAAQTGRSCLYVSENGIGAISLPTTSDHWGARATKAMHPITLHGFAALASLVLDRPLSIENLGLFLTKGQIVQRLCNQGLTEAVQTTVTCDRFSYLGEACGRCSSCILRRVALFTAGIDDKNTSYRFDVLDPAAVLANGKTRHLLAMTSQFEALRQAVTSVRAYAALDGAFPDLFRLVSMAQTLGIAPELVEQRLLRLYRTYVAEFDAFISKINGSGRTSPVHITQLPLTAVSHAIG